MNKRLINQKFIKSLCVAILAFALIIAGFNVFATPATEETGTTDPILVATDSGAEKTDGQEASEKIEPKEAIKNFLGQTGFKATFGGLLNGAKNLDEFTNNYGYLVMILISFVLMYLAIGKGFEPLLLLPIAFGMLLTNLPGSDMFHEILYAGGHVHWDLFGGAEVTSEFIETLRADGVAESVLSTLTVGETISAGLLDYLYLGVKLGIYPCLIFMGVGAMTDFGPLIANPKSLLLGAAAQLGIFATYAVAINFLGFDSLEASSIGIIGGADGPTAIFVTSKLAPHLLGPIAVAAYSYMALVPVIQPPIMKALTTKKERMRVMKPLREVSKKEKIIFPIAVTVFVAFLVPSAAPLIGCLMLGNLFKESGVADRLSKTAQNELMNIVTIFLGVTVGATATAKTFLSIDTIKIIIIGVVAFAVGSAGGVLLAKFMNLFLKNKINPLIGSAGVSAVPMAARVSQTVGQKENPKNFLLMHAMGPNVAGVIGSAIAAGVLLALFG
ncbi:MAG: sodium ion-translocating decarboxylase subunit beta [Clostridia bacterium]|nr:sodium ion-translocating decarboxylase subunit beta [Clostridia bacterium]